MASTTARRGLEGKKRWLEKQLADSKKQTEEIWSKLEMALRETIVIGKQNVVVAHTDDAMRVQGEIEYKIKEIEFLLHPPKGRPKGSLNEQPKPADPTMVAAMEDWTNSPEPKPGNRKLAYRHCKVKTEEGRRKWMHRFKKFKEKAQRLQL